MPDGVFNARERLVGGDAHAPGVEEHRVAGDARLPLIGPAEAAVDHHEAAVRLAGVLPLLCAHGDVAVYDAAPGLVEPKGGKDAAAEILIVIIFIISVLGLLPCRLILDERALERGDVAAAEDGGVAPAPEEPEEIAAVLPFRGAFRRKIALPGDLVAVIEKIAPAQAVAAEFKFHEAAVPVAGDAAMVKQVAVVAAVDRAYGIQEARMLLQPLAVGEGGNELPHQGFFFLGELRRVGRVDGGEIRVAQGVFLAVHGQRAGFPVHAGEHIPVLHFVFRVAADDLPFQLKEDHADGLVHAGIKVQVARLERLLRQLARLEHGSVSVAILLRGEHRERQQVDAVAVFEHVEVVILHAVAHRSGDADVAAGGRTHPHHVVVAPLNVHIVVLHQVVEDHIRMGAAVKDVAYDVQHVHGHAFDERGHFHDEGVRAAGVDDGADDVVVITVLIAVGGGVEQLLHDVGELPGQRLAHLGTGVLGGGEPAHGDEPPEHHAIPVVKIRYGGFCFDELFPRVVDESGQCAAF